jgi:hypothetical protein
MVQIEQSIERNLAAMGTIDQTRSDVAEAKAVPWQLPMRSTKGPVRLSSGC